MNESAPTIFVAIVLFGWIPMIFGLFMALPPRRAVLAAFLVAWLFLPIASIKFAAGIPAYDKMSATCVGVTLAAVLFDLPRLASLRPALLDIPVALFCLCPFASSMANDLGPYDGLSATFSQVVTWGLPYFIGRVYFRDAESFKELAVALFLGGLVYVPLCIIEMRFSPQLHNWVYGYQQHSFGQEYRLGGWRPTVFMAHGLMVGMWMCMTALIGVWLCYAGLRRIRGIPAWIAAAALLITAVMCRSTGAIALLAIGIAVLFAAQHFRLRGFIFALAALPVLYMAARGSGAWDGAELTQISQAVVGYDRADSLAFRIRNETQLAARAMEQPAFGWGGWGRNRVRDRYEHDVSVTDGLWIIVLGVNGIVGLGAWVLMMLLPALMTLARLPVETWRKSRAGPAVVLSVVVILYVFDCVPNAMTNPIFTLCAGGLASFATVRVAQVQRRHVRKLLPVGRPAAALS